MSFSSHGFVDIENEQSGKCRRRRTSRWPGFIFWQRNKLLIVGGRQQDPARLPIFLGLFYSFFSGRYKVPPDKAFTEWLPAKKHQGCGFFGDDQWLSFFRKNQHLPSGITMSCNFYGS